MKIIIYLGLSCLLLGKASAQVNNGAGIDLSKSFQSPEVAALGRFGEYPVSYFTGQANISVPLYDVSYKDLSIPISLNYSSGGLRPDEHPGWVGLGWTLKAGGMITRKVVGIYDEHPKTTLGSNPTTYTYEIGYYYNCGKLTQSNWSSPQFLEDHLTSVIPEFDCHPDEFIFNFNGYSGAFYITRPYDNGAVEIKIRPNGPYHLKAEINEIKDYIDFDDYITTNSNPPEFQTRRTDRSIYKITITDDNGIKYIFGGTDNSIEFNNNGDLSSAHPQATIANTWYLTEIKSPEGYEIQLNYKRAGRVFIENKQRSLTAYSYTYNVGGNTAILYSSSMGSVSYQGQMENISIIILNPVYLESIVTPKQTLAFTTAQSTQLDYPCFVTSPANPDHDKLTDVTDADLSNHFGGNVSKWQKLTEINIPGLYKIKFNYTESATTRLRLSSIDYSINQVIDRSYGFTYNTMYLPDYLSRKTDHWGFYNGRSYAYSGLDYLTLREPDPAYLQAEMLTKITFPTGGYTEFEYERHDYSKVAQQFPFTAPVDNPGIAGGLRIRRITSTANFNAPAVVKDYFYSTNYVGNGTTSSGILSGNPQYSNTGTRRSAYTTNSWWGGAWSSLSFYFGQIVDNNILPLSDTYGSHVTYSEVTEQISSGYTVYKYTNHDNADYRDEQPALFYTNFDSKWIEEGFTRREAFRGLLTDNIVYDVNKNPVKDIHNDYSLDTETPYFKVLWLYKYLNSYDNVELARILSLLYYTRPPLIKKVTEKTYGAGGNYITTSKEYFYAKDLDPANYNAANDNFKEKLVTYTDSKGQTIYTRYAYPADLSTSYPNNPYTLLINANKVSAVIEKTESLLSGATEYVINAELYPYRSYGDNKIYNDQYFKLDMPGSATVSTKSFTTYDNTGNLSFDPRYALKSQFSFDANGNISTSSPKDNSPIAYLWNYNKEFPVAKVLNANNIYESGTSNNPVTQVSVNEYLSGTKYVDYYYPIEIGSTGNVTFTFSYSNPYISGDNLSQLVMNMNGVSDPSYHNNAMLCAKSNYSTLTCSYSNTYTASNVPPGTYSVKATIVSVVGMDPNYYGYNLSLAYPVNRDRVVMANSNIAYTSFETDDHGNWTGVNNNNINGTTFVPTGTKSYVLMSGQPISKAVTSGSSYIVSYWSTAGPFSVSGSQSIKTGRSINGWIYYEHLVTGVSSVSVSGNGSIDELRLYPSNAQMATYTYDAVNGMTGECDANNRIIYYEYDGSGRLSIIRDQDSKILKKICYSYTGTVISCN
jgi:YD repeat-containing protein